MSAYAYYPPGTTKKDIVRHNFHIKYERTKNVKKHIKTTKLSYPSLLIRHPSFGEQSEPFILNIVEGLVVSVAEELVLSEVEG